MFSSLYRLIQEAALRNVSLQLLPASNNQLSVVLSCTLKDSLDVKAMADVSQDLDAAVALRSALQAPLVITAHPDAMETAIVQALTQLSGAVTQGSQTYSALDISSLIQAAAQKTAAIKPSASKAKDVSPKSKAAPAKATPAIVETEVAPDEPDELDDSLLECDAIAQDAAPSTSTPPTNVSAFGDFDEL